MLTRNLARNAQTTRLNKEIINRDPDRSTIISGKNLTKIGWFLLKIYYY